MDSAPQAFARNRRTRHVSATCHRPLARASGWRFVPLSAEPPCSGSSVHAPATPLRKSDNHRAHTKGAAGTLTDTPLPSSESIALLTRIATSYRIPQEYEIYGVRNPGSSRQVGYSGFRNRTQPRRTPAKQQGEEPM